MLTAGEIEAINLDFDSFAKPGEFLGSGGVVISTRRLHGQIRAAHHEVLSTRELRMVHPLP